MPINMTWAKYIEMSWPTWQIFVLCKQMMKTTLAHTTYARIIILWHGHDKKENQERGKKKLCRYLLPHRNQQQIPPIIFVLIIIVNATKLKAKNQIKQTVNFYNIYTNYGKLP